MEGWQMKTKKMFSVMLGIFTILIIIAVCLYSEKIRRNSETQKQYEEILPQDILEKCDLDVTYNQLIERPDEYQMKTTIVMSGEIKENYEITNGIQQVDIITKDGAIKGYVEDKNGTFDLELGKEYVICGQFQGINHIENIPMFRILVMESLEDNK